MPQISLYIDEPTLKKLEILAKREHKSISKWVRIRIKNAIDQTWPENYFSLYGSVSDEQFAKPEQPGTNMDISREKL